MSDKAPKPEEPQKDWIGIIIILILLVIVFLLGIGCT